jgi:hypothetical protein
MPRRLSETQKRLWAQAGELLRKIDPAAPVADLPVVLADAAEVATDTGLGEFYAVADAVAGAGNANKQTADAIPELRDDVLHAENAVPELRDDVLHTENAIPELRDEVLHAENAVPVSSDAISQIPDSLAAYITGGAGLPATESKATAKKTKAEPAEAAPETAIVETKLPDTESAPTTEPVAEAAPVPVLSKAERIDAARASFSLDSVADEYAVSFFRRIVWTGDGTKTPLILAAPVQAPALELSIVGSRTFFSTCIPWAGRGQLPAEAGESTGGAAPLRSLLAAATESALHAARKMARGPGARNAARNGSASAFFQNLAWQRQQTEIAA